jgi:N-acetylmuramoyl-L-alanine amidase
VNFNENDVVITAKTIFGEARGESVAGQHAVAWVIRNRAAHAHQHRHFGDGSPASACLAKYQFSCWNANDPNSRLLRSMTAGDKRLQPFIAIARAVFASDDDPTKGATYYYVRSIKTPAWAIGQKPVASIGHHLFFANIA